MRTQFRIAITIAVLMAGLSVAGASRAHAGVSFQGTFPLPHGSISIGIGSPRFGVGAFVPYGYNVAYAPEYGYGFFFEDRWIPCRPYQSRWIVYDRPYYDSYAGGPYIGGGYGYGYRSYGGHHERPYYYRDYHRGYYGRDWDRGHGGHGGHQGEGHDGRYGHGGGQGHGHDRH